MLRKLTSLAEVHVMIDLSAFRLAMIAQVPNKTYSRKRRRALSGPTNSPSTSSPFPAAVSASSKNIHDTPKRKLRTQKHTARRNTSGSTEDASPERPTKKLKDSSSIATLAGVSQAVTLQPALHSCSQTKMASSDAISSHPNLLSRNNNAPQPSSGSELVKTSTFSLQYQTELDPKQSSAGHPLPFRRTISQTQKENALARPQALGSPFQIAPPSSLRPHTSGTRATKQFVRRPSADVFRAHISPSASFRRRPSGSHALQKKSTRIQDWLVAPRIPPAADESTAPFGLDIDLNKSHSFFSPQGTSTPLPMRRPIHYGTPMTPTPSIPSGVKKLSPRQSEDIIMNDTMTIPEESSVQAPGAASGFDASTSSPRDPGVVGSIRQHPHRIVHLPHDSIFSSFDVSASATTVRVLVDHCLAREGIVKERDTQVNLPCSMLNHADKSPVPEGHKLHDMFSVLALAGLFAVFSITHFSPSSQSKRKRDYLKNLA
jgi:hypothetical protein